MDLTNEKGKNYIHSRTKDRNQAKESFKMLQRADFIQHIYRRTHRNVILADLKCMSEA